MKFWKKFLTFIFLIFIFILLELYVKEIGKLEFFLFEKNFSIGVYLIFILLLSFWFLCFFIKSFFIWFVSLFLRNKITDEERSINQLAKLIVSNNQEFLALFEKAHVVKSMKILKTALALNRGIHLSEPFEKVGLHCIDIYIVREELKKFIKDNSVDSAINLANKVIKVYVEEVCIVKNELLEIAKMAKKASVLFYFDPRKFKYNLPKNFIDEYFSELALLDFEMENDSNKKLKIIEKIHKDFPEKIEILINLLDFIMGNEALKYDDKKILNLIGATLSVNPDRRLSEYLLKLGRKDILEITQSLTFSISDKNKEKLWLLLIIATKMGFFLQCKELVKKIIEVDPSDDIIKFFVKNHLVLSRAPDIISILVGKELKNTNIKNLNL